MDWVEFDCMRDSVVRWSVWFGSAGVVVDGVRVVVVVVEVRVGEAGGFVVEVRG